MKIFGIVLSRTSGLVFALTLLLPQLALGATFELAKARNGNYVQGSKMEGEIVAGDYERFMALYKEYGSGISPLYLYSKGGNVDESLKLGTQIRKLRLETRAAWWDTGREPIVTTQIDNKENSVCASSCFLLYVSGIKRLGNYLAIHRPYLPRDEARKLSDVEYINLQKELTRRVKAYLEEMEVSQFWIDHMFAASSQDYYMPSMNEASNSIYHLMGLSPFVEEVVLTKCVKNQRVDEVLNKTRVQYGAESAEYKAKLSEVLANSTIYDECENLVFSNMQSAAYENVFADQINTQCAATPALTNEEEKWLEAQLRATKDNSKPKIIDDFFRQGALEEKYHNHMSCLSKARAILISGTITRHMNAIQINNPSSANYVIVGDITKLSPSELAAQGKAAYDAKDYNHAKQLFERGVTLGNAECMYMLSWIFSNGDGVPEDDALALSLVTKAANAGYPLAMSSLGYRYQQGENLPRDFKQAEFWYKKAGEAGEFQAYQSLGYLYGGFPDGPTDYKVAMLWYKKAAEHNIGMAFYAIGMLYEFGNGVPVDHAEAVKWVKKAAALHEVAATMFLQDHP